MIFEKLFKKKLKFFFLNVINSNILIKYLVNGF